MLVFVSFARDWPGFNTVLFATATWPGGGSGGRAALTWWKCQSGSWISSDYTGMTMYKWSSISWQLRYLSKDNYPPNEIMSSIFAVKKRQWFQRYFSCFLRWYSIFLNWRFEVFMKHFHVVRTFRFYKKSALGLWDFSIFFPCMVRVLRDFRFECNFLCVGPILENFEFKWIVPFVDPVLGDFEFEWSSPSVGSVMEDFEFEWISPCVCHVLETSSLNEVPCVLALELWDSHY